MEMKRTLLCLTLILALLIGLAVPICAAGSEALEAADYLHSLGLFNGVGLQADGSPNYGLDRAPTRQEAVAMLIRLLGKEEEALDGTWETPFTDVDPWAEPYVGYAYANGLTNGTGDTTFGGKQTVTAAQYLTFVLRALGYSSETDFSWDAAWDKTDALGVTDGSYTAANNKAFLRGDAAIVSAFALGTAKKSGTATLLDALVADGAVSAAAARSSVPPQRSLDSQYRLFARQLLAAGGTETIVPVAEDGWVASEDLSKVAPAYDNYMALLKEPAPNQGETLLADALRDYALDCVDGDYSKNRDLNASVCMPAGKVACLLLTDRRGFVVAYGFWSAETPDILTMVSCRMDSRALMDAAVADFDKTFQNLPVIPCETEWEENRLVYRFSGIPENAVWIEEIAGGASAQATVSVPIKKYVSNHLLAMRNRPDSGKYGDPVENPYIQVPPYKHNQWASCYTLFVFLDANLELVGYSLATYS